MKLLIVVLSVFSREEPTFLSDTLPVKLHTYKVSVYNFNKQSNVGYLAEINDSVLLLSPTEVSYNPIYPDNKNIKGFYYKDISSIRIRRTGATGRAILIGAASGLVAGAIVGFAQGDDPPDPLFSATAGEKAIAVGVIGSVVGAAIGGVIGAVVKRKYTIRGKKEKFDRLRMVVLENAYGIKSN